MQGFNTFSALEWVKTHRAVVTGSPEGFTVKANYASGSGSSIVHAVYACHEDDLRLEALVRAAGQTAAHDQDHSSGLV